MQNHEKFKVGDRVRMLNSGPGASHYLKSGTIVMIVEMEVSDDYYVVQASGPEDFSEGDGWSQAGLGKYLQQIKLDELEHIYSDIPHEKALSASNLPFL